MSDPLSIAASVVGIVLPALHGVRLLLDDLNRIIDAPADVSHLNEEVASLQLSLNSLRAIEETEWKALGETVAGQCQTAITTCEAACETFRGDLQRWTRRAPGGKLSWKDRTMIGFLRQRQIRSLSEHLQSSKLTCNGVVGVATLYSSLRNGNDVEKIRQSAADQEADLCAVVEVTNTRLAEVEAILANVRVTDAMSQDKGGNEPDEDEDDILSATAQLQEELSSLKASRAILPELVSQTKKEHLMEVAEDSRRGTTNISFAGDHNFQVGINNSDISGITFGETKK